jgi:hypothetical protein
VVIVLSLLGAWFWHDADYIRHLAENPQSVTLAQLSATGSNAAGRWVEIKLDAPPRLLFRSTQPTFGRRGERIGEVIMDYYALAGDFASATDRVIIMLHDRTTPPATLVALVAREDWRVYAKTMDLLPSRQGPLSPILLMATMDLNWMRVYWAVVSAVTVAVAIMLLLTLRGLFNPLHAGPIARLRKSVRAPEGLPALAAEINRELAGLDPKTRRMGIILLASWLVLRNRFSFTVISASDVIWVGPDNLFFHGGRMNAIFIFTRYGRRHTATMRANVLPEKLPAFARWAPWAVIGADETILPTRRYYTTSAFKNPRIIAMIDKRRETILAQRAAQPGVPG